MSNPTSRRMLLAGVAFAAFTPVLGRTIRDRLPWRDGEAYPPASVRDGPWLFFTPEEAAMVEAIADRLIPADDLGPGGKDAGCAVFADRQLAGPYGRAEGWYMEGPFPSDPLPTQGRQTPDTPAQVWRKGLAALEAHCRASLGGRGFTQLSGDEQDTLLRAVQANQVHLEGISSTLFFSQALQTVMEGFFADPIYGGNRDMVGWKLVDFPGVRYDYRDVLAHPNEPYRLPPVSIMGRPDWRGQVQP